MLQHSSKLRQLDTTRNEQGSIPLTELFNGICGRVQKSNAQPAMRRRLGCVQAAVVAAGLQEENIKDALGVLSGTQSLRPDLRRDVEVLAGEFDRNYFILLEKAGGVFTPNVLMMFQKARAASAVYFALSATLDPNLLEESLYEAIMASRDKKGIEAVARNALGAPD